MGESIDLSLISKTSSGDTEKAGEVGDRSGREETAGFGTFAFRFTFFRIKLESIMLPAQRRALHGFQDKVTKL